jgi:1-acyl-sn-glycerol-3-phosphate acyltransferase
MIRAQKQALARPMLEAYVGWKVRGMFRGLWTRGALPTDGAPLLVYANHCGFWDGFVAQQLCALTGWDGYCMMEEAQLRRFPFLAKLGAFSVERGPGGSALETLRYARGLLAQPRAAVFVFPEGVLRPFGPPLQLEGGAALLARHAQARCLPVGIRYLFLEAERPDVLVEVGEVHAPVPAPQMQERLQGLVDDLAAATSTAGFEQRVAGARGAAEGWAGVKARFGG